MKILFITDNFPPEVNAPATRTYEHCMEWKKTQDVEITIITCAPNFPHGKVYEGYANRFYQTETIEGIRVIRLWSYMTSNKGFTKRVLDYLSFAFMAFFAGILIKHDVVIATSPQFFTTWAAWAISRVRRTPWIFELRDIWPASIKTVGAMDQGLVMNFLTKIELGLYKDTAKVIAVTDAFKTELIARGIDAQKIDVVTNGSNLELFAPRDKDAFLLQTLHLEHKFIIGYIGTHGLAHKLDFIVRSIAAIEDREIHFLFIGDGAEKAKVVQLAQTLSLHNITFLDAISKDQVPQYLSIIDVSLAPLKKSETFKSVIPSKIFEASAMRKPTLLGVEGQAQQIVERYGAGICFEPENETDFIAKVTALKNDTLLYRHCMEGCDKLAHHFDRKLLAAKMLQSIISVIK